MSTKKGKKRRRFKREFKEEAVKLSERSGTTVRQVAADLGIRTELLHRWRSEHRNSQQAGMRFAPGNGHARDEELERLRKENELLRQERDILKKVTIYFAHHTQ